jgi:hypothetical protein
MGLSRYATLQPFAGAVMQESMVAETLGPNRGVEGFHIGIVGRFTPAAQVRRDAVRICHRPSSFEVN